MKQSLEEKFLAACMSSPPDYECMLKLLDDGFDINMEKKDPITGKSLLSQVLLDRNRYYDEDKSFLECIAWHLGDWVVGDARFANRLNAYYEMVNLMIVRLRFWSIVYFKIKEI